MFPQLIIQSNEYGIPEHVKCYIKDHSNEFTYKHYSYEEIISYFLEIIQKETDDDCKWLCEEICKMHEDNSEELVNGTIKMKDLLNVHEIFAYYFLYKNGGVYMDHGLVMSETIQLSEIIEKIVNAASLKNSSDCLITVKSCLSPIIFNGIMICTPNHPVLKKVINYIRGYVSEFKECCKKNNKTFDASVIKTLTFMHTCCEECSSSVILLNETILSNESNAVIFDKNQTEGETIVPLFYHYFVDKIVQKSKPKEMRHVQTNDVSQIKIGITAAVPSHMFNNGIHQNTLYFYEVLKRIGYVPYLIVTNSDYMKLKKKTPDGWNSSDYENVVSFSQFYEIEFNAVVTFGVQVSHIALQQLRTLGVKLVSYVCGNEYLINSEAIIYNHGESGSYEQDKTNVRQSLFDEIWLIPQMMDLNHCYKKTMSRCAKVIEAPFIWSPRGIQTIAEKNGATLDDYLYVKKTRTKAKKIAIFDPNISIMKWFLPSFVIGERAYQLCPTLIDRIYITNTFRDKIGDTLNSKKIENTVRYTDIFMDKRLFFEKRFITIEFMKIHAEIAIFHQWGNPLNYIYLEMAWLGYPFLHNAHLCSDLGYYYEGYQLEQGAQTLLQIIMKHDDDAIEYLRINRERVQRFLPTNLELQSKYKKMFNDLFYNPEQPQN